MFYEARAADAKALPLSRQDMAAMMRVVGLVMRDFVPADRHVECFESLRAGLTEISLNRGAVG